MRPIIIALILFLSFHSFNLEAKEKQNDINKKISMNFKNMEVGKVLELIAEPVNINFIMKGEEKNRITIDLTDIKGYKAFNMVLKKKDLGKEKCRNIVLIASKETMLKKRCSKSILRKRFHKRMISMDFVNIDIIDILELISDVLNINIIVKSDLQRNISTRLRRVRVDKILELLLIVNNLKKEVLGNVIFISDISNYSKEIEKKSYKSILRKKYKKEKISLNLVDVDIRDVLRLLLDSNKKNLVLTKDVSGNITLKLKNIKKDKALDLILRTKGLAMKKTGDSFLIAPISQIFGDNKKIDTLSKDIPKLKDINLDTFNFFVLLFNKVFRHLEVINLSGKNASVLKDDDLKEFTLIGAMYSKTEKFVLLKTPLGKVHILKIGDNIGKNHTITLISRSINYPSIYVENKTKTDGRRIKISLYPPFEDIVSGGK